MKITELQRFGENGLQAHLRVLHGYAITRLSAFTIVQLVLRHHNEHRGQFIREVHKPVD